MSNQEPFFLADAIKDVRTQLSLAMAEGSDSDIRFKVKEMEMAFKCGVKKGVTGKGGIKFWVINAEAGAQAEFDNVQTIKLKLEPLTNDGGDVNVDSEKQKM